jgi:hypothetical protein
MPGIVSKIAQWGVLSIVFWKNLRMIIFYILSLLLMAQNTTPNADVVQKKTQIIFTHTLNVLDVEK